MHQWLLLASSEARWWPSRAYRTIQFDALWCRLLEMASAGTTSPVLPTMATPSVTQTVGATFTAALGTSTDMWCPGIRWWRCCGVLTTIGR